MAALFDITTSTNTLFLNEVRQGETSFTVTNVDAARRMLQARAHIIPNDASTTGWYTIAGDSQRNFIAGASSEYVVRIQVPQTAPAGFYDFHLLIVEEDDPDENFVEGPSIRLEVRPTLPPAISPAMTIIMIALLVIVVLGGIGFVGWAIVNTAQLANETAALRGVNEILLATATDPALVEQKGIL
jgi:hypothetical protein